MKLHVEKFAQIAEANVEFGDLTILVGPQATGKSLLLQLLKFAIDRPVVAHQLKQHGFNWPRGREGLLSTFLGEGYDACFTPSTRITCGANNLLTSAGRSNARAPRVFFVPAQRVVSITNGWPRTFEDYIPGDPFVVREFSQEIFMSFARGLGEGASQLFPTATRLKGPIRKSIEESIFHGGKLVLKQDGPRKQMSIQYPKTHFSDDGAAQKDSSGAMVSLPFLEWSAGQREFTPLMLGLYQLLPAGKVSKHTDYSWAVIEEPEMGLHPKAINSVMLMVFELLARDYKVAISTHAPYLLDLVWAIQTIKAGSSSKKAALLLQAMGNEHPSLKPIAQKLLTKTMKVYALSFDNAQKHRCTDISSLNPSDENKDIAGWGGITTLSEAAARAVAKGV